MVNPLSSIGNRAILFVLALFAVTVGLGFSYNLHLLSGLSVQNARETEQFVLDKSKEAIRNLTVLAYRQIESYADGAKNTEIVSRVFDVLTSQIRAVVADKDLSVAAKKRKVREIVSMARFEGGTNYVWINDRERLVWHPTKSMVGTSIASKRYRDARGNLFLVDAVAKSSASPDRTAVFEYLWPKQGSDTPEPKISMMRYFPELGWYIGAGIYYSELVKLQQARALEDLRKLRLPDGGYFWINTDELPVPRMLMHPTMPALEGKPLENHEFDCCTSTQAGMAGLVKKIEEPVNLFAAMVQVTREMNEGFVTYDWPKPVPGGGMSEQAFPKLSYVRVFEPWGWVIGTGIYVDDILGVAERERRAFDQTLETMVRHIVIMGLVLAVGFALVLWMYFHLSLGRPLSRLAAFFERVARLDFSVEPRGWFPAETGRLKRAAQSMVFSLRRALDTARDKSHEASEIASVSSRIADAAKAMDQGAATQLEQLLRTSSSMEEMSASIHDVSRNAKDTAEAADTATRLAEEGRETVDKAVRAFAEAEAVVKELSKHSNEIETVAHLIGEIASQTNILALNAAIEAARAGEHGLGFDVVAEEIRKLAKRTTQSTDEVKDLIEKVRSGGERAVITMEKGTAMAGEAGGALAQIVDAVRSTRGMVQSISMAANQQAQTSADIADALQEVSKVSSDTAGASKEVARSTRDLNVLAENFEKAGEQGPASAGEADQDS